MALLISSACRPLKFERPRKKVTMGDKVVVSMNMKLDGVPVEGGQSPNHAVYLNEEYYIPGFKEQLIGLKERGEENLPARVSKRACADHGRWKEVEFDVELKELFHLQPPASTTHLPSPWVRRTSRLSKVSSEKIS